MLCHQDVTMAQTVAESGMLMLFLECISEVKKKIKIVLYKKRVLFGFWFCFHNYLREKYTGSQNFYENQIQFSMWKTHVNINGLHEAVQSFHQNLTYCAWILSSPSNAHALVWSISNILHCFLHLDKKIPPLSQIITLWWVSKVDFFCVYECRLRVHQQC